MTDLVVAGAAYAEANHGRWIAECPDLWCDNAMELDRGQEVFICGGLDSCGFSGPIVWPADPAAVETLLLMRPRRNRHWKPGETIEQLLIENTEHGCLPAAWGEIEGTSAAVVMDVVEQRVTGGLILEQVEAARKQWQIGA